MTFERTTGIRPEAEHLALLEDLHHPRIYTSTCDARGFHTVIAPFNQKRRVCQDCGNRVGRHQRLIHLEAIPSRPHMNRATYRL